MSRSWGTIRIECVDAQHLEEVSALLSHLRRPLVAMGLGRQIILRVPGRPQRCYPCAFRSTVISSPRIRNCLGLGMLTAGVDHQDLAKRGESLIRQSSNRYLTTVRIAFRAKRVA